MKKFTSLFLLLSLCIAPMLGCTAPRPPADTDVTTMP